MAKLNPETVGRLIREAREKAGLTQARLSEAAGIAEQSLSRLERGAYEPAFSTICALADALRVPLDDLARGAAAPPKARQKASRRDVTKLAERAAGLPPRAVRVLTQMVEEWTRAAAPARRRKRP